MSLNNFEPTIVAFCCHYCAYSAADLAGSMRLQYPPNIRIIRTPCTGRLEIEFFLRAFENGADGLLLPVAKKVVAISKKEILSPNVG